jgi:AcrR family transcriptional regulator
VTGDERASRSGKSRWNRRYISLLERRSSETGPQWCSGPFADSSSKNGEVTPVIFLSVAKAASQRPFPVEDVVRLTLIAGMPTLLRGVTVSTSQLRKDAVRNREAILVAARELFADSAEVSMCEVARRAGVGQATLYRNFPDRGALAAEVLGEHIERIAQVATECEGDPDAFFVLLRRVVESVVDLYAVGELAREDACVDSRLESERRRIADLMRVPLSDAKATGSLRRDTSMEDVFLIVLMARGAMTRTNGAAARAAAASRVLTLALEGLVPPSARG